MTKKAHEVFAQLKEKTAGGSDAVAQTGVRSGSDSGATAQLKRRRKEGEGKGHVQALPTRSNTLLWVRSHTHLSEVCLKLYDYFDT